MSDSERRQRPSQKKKPRSTRVGRASPSAAEPRSADHAADECDPLGTLIEQHHVTLAGVILVCGLLAAIGAAALWWGWAQQPRSIIALGAMGVGGLLLIMALVLLFTNIFNVGRSLELRKRGIRYTERGQTTEILWKEIAAVETDRLDSTFAGVATRYTRSDNAVAPSGPLTRSQFTVTIVGDDGRTIRLPPSFLQCVSDPKRLISKLKVRSGM